MALLTFSFATTTLDEPSPISMPSLSSKRLYLRGLQKDITEGALAKYLSCYGKISEVKMLQNYSFVQFESEKDAQVVLETYRHQPLLGRYVIIEFAHRLRKDVPLIPSSNKPDKMHSSTRSHSRYPVVVTNIPRDVRWQELKDFGRLSGRLVAYCDLDQTQRGRGFIEYFTKQDAERAVRILDGKRLFGRRVHVMDHESTGRTSNRHRERLRSRSRSPELGSSRRYGENSTFHRTYSYPTMEYYEDYYVRTEPRHPLSIYSPNAEGRRGFFDHSPAATGSYMSRVTGWKCSGSHDYYHAYDDVSEHCVGDGHHDHTNSGFYGSELCRDYNVDLYQP